MGPPPVQPIGIQVARTAKVVGKAFDDVLVEAGGSLPVWLVLVSLKAGRPGMQRDLATSVGVEGPTLTHHLNKMEAAGLVQRTREPQNRRIHRVELTAAGDALFHRLRRAVTAFDARLRKGITEAEITVLGDLLTRLRLNVAEDALTEESS